MKTSYKILLALLALSVPFVSGCNDGGPSSKTFVKSGHAKRLRVAVLPFDNVSKDQDAGRVLTNTVVTYLLSTGDFDVVEPGVVYAAMGSENVRLSDGLTVDMCQRLQPKLNADAYIMGMVEEYGEVRIGPDTYPSVSFSARLVNARTADILWAATISKTGADNVKVFDIGRVSSLGKLSKKAVATLAVSLAHARGTLSSDITAPTAAEVNAGLKAAETEVRTTEALLPATTATVDAQPAATDATTATTATDTTTAPATPAAETVATINAAAQPAPPAQPAAALTGKSADESAVYGEKELTALLKDVGTARIGGLSYKKHYHDTVEGKYTISGGKEVEVRLVDYRTPTTSQKFLQGYNPGVQQATFEGMPAFTGDASTFGYYHLDLAIGRFGIFLRGPKANQAEIEAIGKGLVAQLK